MTVAEPVRARHPAAWVPTLYFAEGLPFFAVSLMAGLFYKRRGVPNDVIALWVSLLLWPWSLKPLWSPLLEMYRTRKFFVVLTEVLGGLSLVLVALSLPLSGYFRSSLLLLALVALCSSTHDIAADGLYIGTLSAREQARYAGWQGGFYNVARFFSQGALVIVAGLLEARLGVAPAWMAIFGSLGALLVLLGLYHARMLPPGAAAAGGAGRAQVWAGFRDVVASFFGKPNILLLLLFVLLYRAGEGQVVRIGPLFLVDRREAGGLGLTTEQFGTIYGTLGTIAFIAGSVQGGYFTAARGLRRALVPLICAMNLPNLAYVYLSVARPESPTLVSLALGLEMFGYGFGFVGVILLMMQEIAPGPYPTAHYAFATALMNLGLLLPGTLSGTIQMALGYRGFFLWVLVSALPALLLARALPMAGGAPAAAKP